MKFKILDMSKELDKKILLTYFFKKIDTVIDKNELLSMSCIHYNSKQKSITAHTKRVKESLKAYTNRSIGKEKVDETIKSAIKDCFTIHEEIVRCDFVSDTEIDHFYIAVIGVDFFMIESDLRK